MTDPLAPPPGALGRRGEAAALAARLRQRAPVSGLQRRMGCPPPVWMNTGAAKRPDGRCVWFSGVARCARPAGYRAWIGCTAGEHLDSSALCPAHARHMSAWKAVLHCQRCWEALSIVSDARVIRIEEISC